jgi:hypothetical protein
VADTLKDDTEQLDCIIKIRLHKFEKDNSPFVTL